MIRYSLTCDQDHGFDSWFQSGEAFDKLAAAGMIACAVCGSTKVRKALMAPRLNAQPPRDEAPAATDAERGGPLSAPASPAEAALAELRRHVERSSEYVGVNFATEARAIHSGDAPKRPIYGEARPDEAMRLLEEGVPVAPLPFLPTRKSN